MTNDEKTTLAKIVADIPDPILKDIGHGIINMDNDQIAGACGTLLKNIAERKLYRHPDAPCGRIYTIIVGAVDAAIRNKTLSVSDDHIEQAKANLREVAADIKNWPCGSEEIIDDVRVAISRGDQKTITSAIIDCWKYLDTITYGYVGEDDMITANVDLNLLMSVISGVVIDYTTIEQILIAMVAIPATA